MTSEPFPSPRCDSPPWCDRTDRATRPILPARPVVSVPWLAARLRTRFARQVASFAVVGVVSTLAYVALFAALRDVTSAGLANAAALLITAVGNTAANRRLTFAVQGREGLARDHMAGLLAFAVALAITSASLGALHLLVRQPGRGLEVAVLVTANGAATAIRFLLLRIALYRRQTMPNALAERTHP